ncbi:MAG: GNAT family N-acetyltransferase [Acidiferrobacterales bacterium]
MNPLADCAYHVLRRSCALSRQIPGLHFVIPSSNSDGMSAVPSAATNPNGMHQTLPAKDKHEVELVTTTEGWEGLAPHWDALVTDSASNSAFLTRAWMQDWVRCFLGTGRCLFVLIVRDSGRPVAIAPWYMATSRCAGLRSREIRFLGTPETGSDYLDVIVRHGQERDAADAIYRFLFGAGSRHWDQLSLGDIPADSLFLFHFMNRLEEEGKFVELRRHAYIPRAALPATAECFFAGLSSGRRARYRQDWRRLEEHGNVQHVTCGGPTADEGLRRFFALYDTKSGHDGHALHQFLQTFFGSRTAVVPQIDILSVEGCDVAALLHLAYGTTLHLLLMVTDKAFDRRISVGNALLGKCLENAIAANFACYDFLKGGEEYKFHWANGAKISLSLQVGQRRLVSYLCTSSRLLRYLAKALLR